jgi:serine phosphatase RsbU (regulator of sigma subunit)
VLSKRIRVWSLQELYRFSRTERIASGIFFGVIAALVCYNLFLFISLRDRSYLYYFLYLVHISLFIAAYQGMGFEYLWPDRPGWNRDIMYALVGLAMCFAILFTRSFLDTPGTVPRLDRVLVAIAALAVIGSVGSYWNVLIGDRIAYIVCVSLLITCFTAGILSWLGGFLPARYYLTAWSVLIISSFVYILDALGVYRYPGISSMNTLKFGVTCEALLLSLGLASRIKILDQQVAEQEAELETASRMQLGLMPQESPQVPGYEIAGRCLPATHVGGDLYQYFQTSDELLAISLADVTGHAMEAAIPVVMFSGILQSHVEMGYSPGDLIKKLNSSVHNRLGKRTFVCFALGELNTKTGAFKITNAGIPFPYHYRSATRDVQELEVVAFPLGIRLDTEFSVMEVQLEPGDRIVFCSDGIMESANSREDFFGFDRTAETIRQGCRDGLDAEALVDRLIDKVKNFCGEEPQKDDITCVVLRVEEDLKNEQE